MNRRSTSLSLKDKLEILNDIRNNGDKRDLCLRYKISRSTLNRITKNEEHIRNLVVTGKNINRKRQRSGIHSNVEKALGMWIKDCHKTPSQEMILKKAKEFAQKFNEDFNPGLSWLYRWYKRDNIIVGKSNKKPIENNDKPDESYYAQNLLPMILQDYEPDCIFNASECGLYYKVVPSACKGMDINANEREMRKARFTLVLICNAKGTFKRIYAIGNKKISMQRKHSPPIPYFVNKNALLTPTLWYTILSDLDAELCADDKKIVLFASKTACHAVPSEFNNINVQLLPRKSKILVEPMDNGIIKSFKIKYREQMIKKEFCAIERGKSLRQFTNEFSTLQGLLLLKQTLSMMKSETIEKCFELSGFIPHEKTDPGEIQNYSFLKLIPNKTDFIHIDDNIKCTLVTGKNRLKRPNHNPLESSNDSINVDEEIPQNNDEETEDSEDESDSSVVSRVQEDNTELEIPTATAALLALETVQSFCMLNGIECDSLEFIEKIICKHLIKETKETALQHDAAKEESNCENNSFFSEC